MLKQLKIQESMSIEACSSFFTNSFCSLKPSLQLKVMPQNITGKPAEQFHWETFFITDKETTEEFPHGTIPLTWKNLLHWDP